MQTTSSTFEFVDKAIATYGITLWDNTLGQITNAAQFLIRPTDMRIDESGQYPGETFVMATLTRDELRSVLDDLEQDWADVVYHVGDPNTEAPVHSATQQEAATLVKAAFLLANRATVAEMDSNAVRCKQDGTTWWDTRPMLDPAQHCDTALSHAADHVAYAVATGLATQHPEHAHLLRLNATF